MSLHLTKQKPGSKERSNDRGRCLSGIGLETEATVHKKRDSGQWYYCIKQVNHSLSTVSLM